MKFNLALKKKLPENKKKKKKLSKEDKKKVEIGIIISISVLSILLWDTFIIYPIKMFVVMFHEISHGLATVFTGGKINYIQFTQTLGGACISEGGSKFIIASSGYLGSLIVGSLMFLFAYDEKKITILNVSLGLLLIFFTANYFVDPVNIIFALVFAIVLFVSPKYFHPAVNSYMMKSLGLISALYVLTDIKEDLLTLTYRPTDAQLLAEITPLPAIVWGLLWFGISGVVVYYLFKYGYKQGLKY